MPPDPPDPLDDDLDDDLEPWGRGTGQRAGQPPVDLDRRIGAELRHIIESRLAPDGTRWSYRRVADWIEPSDPRENWTKNRVHDIVNAGRRATIVELLDLLRCLGERPDRFLDRVGVIRLPRDTRSHIETDPRLDPPARAAMLALYDTTEPAINGS
jgi:hypothetical protein